MTYTVVSYIILVGFLVTSASASERNDTDEHENSNLTTPIIFDERIYDTANSTMSTITHSTVNQTDITQTSSERPQERVTPTAPQTRPTYPPTHKPTKPITKANEGLKNVLTTTPQPASGNDSVGIIILVVIIVIAFLAGFICFVARSRARRYSVDLTSRPDEAQIPLSAVEPEGPVETVTSNGLQFDGTENSTQEAEEPEVKTEEQVEQKAESEKVTPETSGECAAPTVDNLDEQPKHDTTEPSPAAPTEPSPEEKTDDEGGEGAISNKTSVESLKEINEANENNSNSSLLPQRGARGSEAFCDASLDNIV